MLIKPPSLLRERLYPGSPIAIYRHSMRAMAF
jgi:hypothetical protein